MLHIRHTQDTVIEIGVDEAGRGPLWGPMMAAAVVLPFECDLTPAHRELLKSVKDSKKLTSKKRDILSDSIQTLCIGYGIGTVHAEEIDRLGATRANQLVFRRALTALYTTYPLSGTRRILVDGTLPLHDGMEDEVCRTIVDGDATYLSIAAASILAKVAHDRWVLDWCKDHVADAAKYDLLRCKGYGTANHRKGILDHGYTDLHRRLYLRKLIPGIVVSRCNLIED